MRSTKNISPPLVPVRFFLTKELFYNNMYKSKIEKYNVSLDIFV